MLGLIHAETINYREISTGRGFHNGSRFGGLTRIRVKQMRGAKFMACMMSQNHNVCVLYILKHMV
jgi:hypothetical protein